MKRLTFFLLIIMLGGGCMATASIGGNSKEISYSDGISQDEAKIIAKNYIIEHKIKNVDISNAGVRNCELEEGIWEVRFISWNMKIFTVMVDKKTGKIFAAEWSG